MHIQLITMGKMYICPAIETFIETILTTIQSGTATSPLPDISCSCVSCDGIIVNNFVTSTVEGEGMLKCSAVATVICIS